MSIFWEHNFMLPFCIIVVLYKPSKPFMFFHISCIGILYYNSNYGEHSIKLSLSQPTRKSILQFDLDGNLIREWNSNKEIIKHLKIYHTLHCCKGLYKQSGGYVWKYK